jgi:broad specificity phosphatase PhoE
LGKTDLIRKEPFWRRYSSDLGRAQTTTRLILSIGDDLTPIESLGVSLEPRLRELAKGAREGLSKSMSYEEAKVIFWQRHGPDTPFPLLETEEAVWERTKDWLMEVIGDAVKDYRQQSDNKDKRPKVYSVFVVLHAGTLRTALKYLVPEQMPETVDLSTQTFDGSTSKHLKVPNTSVTIVDISLLEPENEIWDKERTSQRLSSRFADLWRAKLQQLTWTDHYQLVE